MDQQKQPEELGGVSPTSSDIPDDADQLDYDWGGDGSNPHEPVRAHLEAALLETTAAYPPPLDQLLRLGEPEHYDRLDERLPPLGLTQEHVPDLIRMARDRRLHTSMSDSDEVWGPIYALHALKQLDAGPYVADLVPLFDVDADWTNSLLLELLPTIGAPALEPLQAYIQDRTRWVHGRAAAGEALSMAAQRHPELREPAIAILVDELGHAAENHEFVNSFLVTALQDLNAVEALPAIRQAFELGAVDETIMGDWGSVLAEFGQEPEPDDPLVQVSNERWAARRAEMLASLALPRFPVAAPASPRTKKKDPKAQQKQKRKMAKASRKGNRGKKKR